MARAWQPITTVGIDRNGLIEPIVVRPLGQRYQLIAGERRLRAAVLAQHERILSRVVEVDDLQARRMCAAENLQREDLSPVETVTAIVELVDSELIEDTTYQAMGATAVERVKGLLSKLDSVRRSEERNSKVGEETIELSHKFVGQIERIFAALPKSVEWRSFYNNDLPLVTDLDSEVQEAAVKLRLNKSQAKALNELKEASPTKFQQVVSKGASSQFDLSDYSAELDEQVALGDLSARDHIKGKVTVFILSTWVRKIFLVL